MVTTAQYSSVPTNIVTLPFQMFLMLMLTQALNIEVIIIIFHDVIP